MMFLEEFFVHAGLVIESFEIGFTRKLDQVVVALQIRGKEDQVIIVIVREETFPLPAVAWGEVRFASDNGFDSLSLRLLIEFNGAKEVPVVGHGHGGLPEISDLIDQWVELVCAIKQAVMGVQMKVDEFGFGGHDWYPENEKVYPWGWGMSTKACALIEQKVREKTVRFLTDLQR